MTTLKMTTFKMTNLRIIGVAAMLSLLAGPVIAKPFKHGEPRVASQACDRRDPGNPFSERYDYETWTRWRGWGGWDTRAEWTCQPIPSYAYHHAYGFGRY
jgi:hypothetical protein